MTLAVNIAQSGSSNVTFRNKIINGAMTISQRNGTSATSVSGNDVYTIDRYKGWANGGGVFSVTQSTTAPSGFSNSALITVTTADSSIAASDNYRFAQVVEGYNIADLNYGASGASTVTLSFWVRSSVTGTFGGSFYSSPATRSYVFNYTISSANTWTYITTTATGDTSGSWNNTNGQGMTIYFDLGSGSNYENATGSWVGSEKFRTSGNATLISTLNATLYITGVQLEAGTTASPFEYRQYGTELQLCQRYCEVYTNSIGGSEVIFPQSLAQVDVSNRPETNLIYAVKRAAPTITVSTGTGFQWQSMANTGVAIVGYQGTSVGTGTQTANLFFSVSSGVNTNTLSGVGYIIFSGTNKIYIDAEL